MLKFSDFAEEVRPLDGKKVKIAEILNKKMVVINYKIKQSQYKKGSDRYATIQAEIDDERLVIFTGSLILIEQLEKYGDKMPFEAEIKQIDKFFTFI